MVALRPVLKTVVPGGADGAPGVVLDGGRFVSAPPPRALATLAGVETGLTTGGGLIWSVGAGVGDTVTVEPVTVTDSPGRVAVEPGIELTMAEVAVTVDAGIVLSTVTVLMTVDPGSVVVTPD